MVTKEQAAKAFKRYLESGDSEDAQIVVDYLDDDTEKRLNVEKYAAQIARALTSAVNDTCLSDNCENCPIDGFCTDEKKLEDWMLQEAEE